MIAIYHPCVSSLFLIFIRSHLMIQTVFSLIFRISISVTPIYMIPKHTPRIFSKMRIVTAPGTPNKLAVIAKAPKELKLFYIYR